MAGRLGCGGGPAILFPPFRLFKALVLKEGEGDHRHQAVSVQAGPRSAFEVVKPELFLELLMRLLADPARLDGTCKLLHRGVWGQVGQIAFALSGRAMFADQPDFLARQMLGSPFGEAQDRHVMDTLGRAVGHTHAQG